MKETKELLDKEIDVSSISQAIVNYDFNKIIDLCHLETALFIVKPDIIEDDKYGRVLSPKELRIIAAGGTLD